MHLRAGLKLFAFLVIAAICITLAVVLVPPPAKHTIPGLTILDSRLQVSDCRISYGTNHSSDHDFTVRHPLLAGARADILTFKARLFHQPYPVLLLNPVRTFTGTNAVALIFGYTWHSSPTNLAVEMTDAAGHDYSSRTAGMVTAARSNITMASFINAIDCPTPPPPGDYQFQILLGTNGPVLATYKTTLNLK